MKEIIKNRKIEGISAILLPIEDNGEADIAGLLKHCERTFAAGLTPAVNMDTGYANLLTMQERLYILEMVSELAAGRRYVAGAFIEGQQGDLLDLYERETNAIEQRGGLPIIFQSSLLTALEDDELLEFYGKIASKTNGMLAFELGKMFAPFGRIYSLEMVEELMKTPKILGVKHSSLRRVPEWQRLALRDRVRPDFKIYTGNDLAIDMVMYGSDYLLGLSTFAPDYFALRDRYWQEGDARFYELNDVLQYLGQFAFRAPTAAYKHSAAQFLKLRGWIETDLPHPLSLRRPESDIEILQKILDQLSSFE